MRIIPPIYTTIMQDILDADSNVIGQEEQQVISPSEPIPEGAKVRFNGENYEVEE